jgi:hypothetical protein
MDYFADTVYDAWIRNMLLDVRGIIVAYNMMTGVVLLQPNGPRGLAHIAKSYVASKSDKGFWFARFQWSDISMSHRTAITERRGERSIRDFLLGRPVRCDLERAPKWRAVQIHIMFIGIKYGLPKRRFKRAHKNLEMSIGKIRKTKNGRSPRNRRSQQSIARVSLNGETGVGGIVYPPVGGKKPGSYKQ